jgi:hypothetical protein
MQVQNTLWRHWIHAAKNMSGKKQAPNNFVKIFVAKLIIVYFPTQMFHVTKISNQKWHIKRCFVGKNTIKIAGLENGGLLFILCNAPVRKNITVIALYFIISFLPVTFISRPLFPLSQHFLIIFYFVEFCDIVLSIFVRSIKKILIFLSWAPKAPAGLFYFVPWTFLLGKIVSIFTCMFHSSCYLMQSGLVTTDAVQAVCDLKSKTNITYSINMHSVWCKILK